MATPAATAPTPAPTRGKRTAPRATSSPVSATRTGKRVRNAIAARNALTACIGNARRFERRHLTQDRERGREERQREGGAASFPEPEAEVEQWLEPELREHERMTRLRRAMRRDHRVDRRRIETRGDQRGRRGDEAVEQHHLVRLGRPEHEADEKGELASTESREDAKRIAGLRVRGKRTAHDVDLARDTVGVEAGALAANVLRLARQ